MSDTFTQIHIQAIVAVKFREALIHPSWSDRLYRYIIATVQNGGHKVLAINSMPDHLHLFFGCRPHQALSDLMQTVKADSTKWINHEKLTPKKFSWQEGYGAFSYARSQVRTVAEYVENQQRHHKKKTFLQEYKGFLKAFEIEYEERNIFQPLV